MKNKIFKKLLTGSLVLLTGATLSLNAFAGETDYLKSDFDKEDLAEYENLSIGQWQCQSLFNGNTEVKSTNDYTNYTWNNHTIYWADFATGDNCKVVSYQSNDMTTWGNMTTVNAAKAWEKANPGWKVYAAINGDFFDINATKAPTGVCMTEGDLLQPSTRGESSAIGWKEDQTVIFGTPTVSTNMYVRVYAEDGKTIEKEIEVTSINPDTYSSSGVTLVTKATGKTIDVTGATVYECDQTMFRVNKYGDYFLKGTCTGTVSTTSVTSTLDKFFLICSDGSLDSILSKDANLKVEYKLTGEWADVTEISGYNNQVLSNGEALWQGTNDSFAYTTHPRTLIGIKEDGSCVFLTIDGRGTEDDWYVGASLYQAALMLKNLGCVNGFNLDGGGSTTLVYRNMYGNLEVANRPSDGSERSDGNHLFIVKRDPGFKVSVDNNYSTCKITLKVTNETYYNEISNIKVTMDGKTVDYVEGGVTFTGLDLCTTYDIKVSYDIKSITDETKTVNDYIEQSYTTQDFEVPDIEFKVTDIGKDNATLVCTDASAITNMVAYVDGKSYSFGSSTSVKITDLFEDTEYEIEVEYDYQDTNHADEKVREIKTHVYKGSITFTTNKFNMPTIEGLTLDKEGSDYVRVAYEYTDEGELVTGAYLLVNEDKIDILSTGKLKGTYKVENLDLENKEYSIKLVIEYNSKKIESDSITVGTKQEEPTPSPEPTPTPSSNCGNSAFSLIASLILAASMLGIVLKKRN